MPDTTNDIDALLTLLAKFGWEQHHATAKALVAERNALKAELVSKTDELAAMRQQRDEAHGLIRNWQTDFIRVLNDSTLAYVPVATYDMNEADKRAFSAATRKEGGGA
jgi:hypothetical protein